jgi:hypothetical protein
MCDVDGVADDIGGAHLSLGSLGHCHQLWHTLSGWGQYAMWRGSKGEIAAVIAMLGLISFIVVGPLVAPQFFQMFKWWYTLSLVPLGLFCLIFLKRW